MTNRRIEGNEMPAQPHHPPCASPAQHDEQARFRESLERAHERAKCEVISYLEDGFSDVEELIQMLDGDGPKLLCKVLLRAYKEGRASKWYSDAEQLVDALATAEMDREALG